MGKQSRRKQRQARNKIRANRRYLIWGGLLIAAGIVVGIIVFNGGQVSVGEAVALLPATHIAEGTDPGTYNTDPPTSGPHYATSLKAGFYQEADVSRYGPYPAGYLVHNLEHGYVIFWYNCAVLSSGQTCDGLNNQIQSVMDQKGGNKLIAFPWSTTEVPVAMTSWGRIQQFDSFDQEAAAKFVDANRFHAPEPDAP